MTFRLNRRQFGFGLMGLAGASLLPGQAFAQGATRPVTTSLGTYDIPADPQRVICIDSRLDLEPAVALGLKVVGHAYDAVEPWVPSDPNWVFVGGEPSAEAILALDPDLIICTDVGNPDSPYWPINKLKTVAPLLQPPYSQPWKSILSQIGDWVGRTEAANGVLAEYDALIADIRARRGDLVTGRKLAALQPNEDGGVYLSRLSNLQPQVLVDLGANTLPLLADGDENAVSSENLGEILGDVDGILVVNHGDGGVETLAQDPLWQRLKAVKAGAVLSPRGNTNFGGVYTAIHIAKLFDELYGMLA